MATKKKELLERSCYRNRYVGKRNSAGRYRST